MNKDQLKARAKELGLDTDALDSASKSKNKTATNDEIKKAIAEKEAELKTAALQQEALDLGINTEGMDTDEKLQEAIDANIEFNQLKTEAEALEIEVSEDATIETLKKTIEDVKSFNELLAEAKDLKVDITGLSSHDDFKNAIAAKKKSIAAEKAAARKKENKTWTDQEGRQWFFTAKAPKTINIDGRPMTQAEILESEDVISELAYGNSTFLTQKY